MQGRNIAAGTGVVVCLLGLGALRAADMAGAASAPGNASSRAVAASEASLASVSSTAGDAQASPASTTAGSNEDVVAGFYDALNHHALDALDQLVSDDFVNDSAYPGQKPGKAGLKAFLWKLSSAFPDGQVAVLQTVTQGDTTVVRYRFSGTQRHAFLGIQATKKHVAVTGVDIWTLSGGKIVQGSGSFDTLGMLVQLGIAPALR